MFLKYFVKDVSAIRDANLGACSVHKVDIFPREHECLDALV
jgi:hypothetical protein